MSRSAERIHTGVLPVETWFPPASGDATFRYIDISSVDRHSKSIVGVTELQVRGAPSRARQILRADDVLVSTVRPNLNAVAIVPKALDGAIGSTGFTVLRANPKRLLPRFLFYWVRSPAFLADMTKKATGASYPAVSDRIVLESSMPMPHVDEQCHTADILDKADAICCKRKETIALTEELLRSAFFEMFGDPVTNPKRWPVKPLGQLLAFLTSGSRGWAEYYADTGDIFLRIQNTKQDRLDLSDIAYVRAPDSAEARRTRTCPGDVLLSITADLGRTAVVPDTLEKAFINQHLAILRPREVNSEYLSSFLSSEGGQRQIKRLNKGGVKAGLNFDDIRSIDVLTPPDGLQREFAEAKAQIRRLEASYVGVAQEGDALFQSLVARAFSGNLSIAEGAC
ncbi:MAG TPA: restriction endonuclease subunit S [Thermoanaerobaculia bacterium]|nr:restriction endonuclease subunit S [Thermoanaerobaculia bacterium]